MEEVPQETWLLIFSFLSPTDSPRVCLTCKWWNEIWQDKTLWKHFQIALIGGKPRPPLLPKAWMKSVKIAFSKLQNLKRPRLQLEFAIEEGHTVLANRVLRAHPRILYPRVVKKRFVRPSGQQKKCAFAHHHPLQLVAQGTNENLEMMKLIWSHLAKTSKTDDLIKKPKPGVKNHLFHPEQLSAAMSAQKAVRVCISELFRTGGNNAALLDFILEVFPDAIAYVRKHWRRLSTISYYMKSPHSTQFFEVLEKKVGVVFIVDDLQQSILNEPLAHWLLDRLSWQADGARAIISETLSSFGWRDLCPRSVMKRLLSEGTFNAPFPWMKWTYEYLRRTPIDKKIVKWFIQRAERDGLPKDPEIALNCYEITTRGNAKLFKHLFKIGAIVDVNWVGRSTGRTLLHYAVEKNHVELIKALLECGADPKAKGRKGAVSPLSIASQLGQHEVRALLLDATKKKQKKKQEPPPRKRKSKELADEEEKEAPKEEEGTANEKENGTNGKEEKSNKKRKVEEKKGAGKKTEEEKMLEDRIGELMKWICETDATEKITLKEVVTAQQKDFTVFPLKMVCRKWHLKPTSQKRVNLLQAILTFLEGREAMVQAEV